MSKQQHQHTNI